LESLDTRPNNPAISAGLLDSLSFNTQTVFKSKTAEAFEPGNSSDRKGNSRAFKEEGNFKGER
jgi:hypothetical protein